jgi:hypothetical protein
MSPVRSRNPSTLDSRHWRDCAENARLRAETFTDPLSRRMMRRIAESYDLLADTTEHIKQTESEN